MEEMEDDATQGDEYSIPDLSWVTGFSYEDIAFNARGQLSPAQKQEAEKRIWHQAIVFGFLAVVTTAEAYDVAGWIGAVAFPIWCVIGGIKTFVDARAALARGVFAVEGDIWTEKKSNGYFIHVDGSKIEITADAYEALIPGGPYRIYYIEDSDSEDADKVVGGEVLPGWRAIPPPAVEKSWWKSLSIEIG